MTEVTVYTEHVDDIPLLIRQQQEMGIAEVINNLAPHHGNREGVSLGELIIGWLAFIVSQADHRLSYVEEWSAKRQQTLSQLFGRTVTARDFTDDRLGDALSVLSKDAIWFEIERQLNERIIRVYALPTDTVRIDTTTVSLYHNSKNSAVAAYGHSKEHRSDLAQMKVLLATLDPLAMPLVTMTCAGNEADDGLYLPAIAQVRRSLPDKKHLLYVGDSKMEASRTRAQIDANGDYYLTPLSQKGDQRQLLFDYIAEALADTASELIDIYPAGNDQTDKTTRIGQGLERVRQQEVLLDGVLHRWQERVLLIHSTTLADSGRRGLQQRLQRAEAELLALTPTPGRGKRQATDLPSLETAVAAILDRYAVTEYLQVRYHCHTMERSIRAYKERPTRIERTIRYEISLTRDETAISQAECQLGWRLYVTNAPVQRLSLPTALHTYRGSVPTIERDFSRLKGHPLGLRPIFVQRDDRMIGLTRLLSLGLCIMTLIEYVVRCALQETQECLAGLYPGNPKQTTTRPTCERILRAFHNLTVSCVDLPEQQLRHVTPLSPLQSRILQLLRLSPAMYTDLSQRQPNST